MTIDLSTIGQPWTFTEEAAAPTPCVFVIGAGLVGTALAGRLNRVGVPVSGIHGRLRELSALASGVSGVLASSGDFPESVSSADVVIVCVRDSRVPEIAKRLADEGRLRPNQIVLHTSGNRSAAEMLAAAKPHVAGIGTMHPLIAVTDAPGALDNLAGAYFGIEGDEAARKSGSRLARMVGGVPIAITAEKMALYHAGAIVASNYVVALTDLARRLLVAAGIPEGDALPALVPLINSAVRNVAEVGLPAAMTGPVVRGDVVSVERHLAALKQSAPELTELYRRLGQETLRIARQQQVREPIDAGAVAKLAALFGGGETPIKGGAAAATATR